MGAQAQIDDDPAATRAALVRLARVVACAVVVAASSYAVPGLARFRPWLPGEGVPIARLFGTKDALPVFAEAGGVATSTEDARRLAGSLGDAVARSLAQADDGAAEPRRPASGPALRIEPSEYEGITQRIENAGALAPFFAKLERSARGEAGAITRVAHYGDSAVAADEVTHTLRRKLQTRFGDAGHGFILIARGAMHYLHRDIRVRASDDWEVYPLVLGQLGKDWYGYGGVQYRGPAGASAWFATSEGGVVGRSVSRFEIFYQRYRGGGTVQIEVDGKRHGTLDTRGDTQQDAWQSIAVPDGPHSLSLRAGGGRVPRLYGVAFERDVPGVVYDSLGLVGAVAERMLNAERDHIQRQLAHRAPDLIVLAFGGNEAANAWLQIPAYEKGVAEVVDHLRGGEAKPACLLFAPLDQGERDERGEIVTIKKMPEIVEAQRRVAKAKGCAFYDTFSAMGGLNSVRKWHRSRPRLVTSDFKHATPQGYVVIGDMVYKALLAAFAEHLGS